MVGTGFQNLLGIIAADEVKTGAVLIHVAGDSLKRIRQDQPLTHRGLEELLRPSTAAADGIHGQATVEQ
ncbi:MAG: hypothetical protein O3C17_24965 [Planctomycetota bacterium]|nr:hypothetical protein [Planctomycetota bacterium]